MISIQPDWQVLTGFILTMILGLGVGCLVRHVGNSIFPLSAPSVETTDQWARLVAQKTGGAWIGYVERPIFFAALWMPGAWPIITSWLVFKLAFYWQNTNFSKFPDTLPDAKEAEYLVAKRQLGTHHVSTALVGTGANIVVALVGVAVGRCIVF